MYWIWTLFYVIFHLHAGRTEILMKHSNIVRKQARRRCWNKAGCWRLKISVNSLSCRVAEVAREHGWHPPKSLDSDENFKPEHTLFCRELRFVAIYALFGDLWAKKVPFWVKNSVSWARSALLHDIYRIFHWVNFANLRLRAKTTHLTQKL